MLLKISSIEIKYFKFYKHIKIDNINGKSILLYGENGSGKSSLYFALEKLFFSYFRNSSILANIEKDKNNKFDNNIYIKVILTNSKALSIYNKNQSYHIKSITNLSKKQSIYFLNTESLNRIISEDDLFISFKHLKLKFPCLDNIFKYIENIKLKVDRYNINGGIERDEIIDDRKELDSKLEDIILSLSKSINLILEKFKDDMKITLVIKNSEFNIGAKRGEFISPKILILVNGKVDYKEILHEGKFRLLSLAIFFALMNESEKIINNEENIIKLLVLDDFLSSLDMGNRMYVMKYIFETYKEYQKIIATHNLTLFNVIKKLTNKESSQWQFKNIFFKKATNYYEPEIYDIKDNYLEKAKKEFEKSEFEICGNLLRKELERIISQFEIKLVISDREKLSNIIDKIRKDDIYVLNSQEISFKVEKTILNIEKYILNNDKLNKTEIVSKIRRRFLELDNIEKVNLEKFNRILCDLDFHKDILLNKASHMSYEEHYRKEYEQAIIEIEKLQKLFNNVFNK